MALWSAWFPDVMPHVEGCPYPVVEHELRRAAQLFFEGSRAWRIIMDPISVSAGEYETVIQPDISGTEVVRIEDATYDGKRIDVYTVEEMAGLRNDWTSDTGVPEAIIKFKPGEVRLYPTPIEASTIGLKCTISVKPSETSTGIPDNLRAKYMQDIAGGAKGRLMMYPKKSWSSPELGMAYLQSFDSAISKACLSAALAFGNGRIPAKVRWC